MGSDGFEPPKLEAADLQSAPFGHSGNYPSLFWASCRIRTNDPEITHRQQIYSLPHLATLVTTHIIHLLSKNKRSMLSLLSDSNQRPRDYKSRALANWAKEAGGQAIPIAPLQPSTLAPFPTWGVRKELVVGDLSMFTLRTIAKASAKIHNLFNNGKCASIFSCF